MRPQDLAALPPARLARDGLTVVCGTPGCGVRFGRLEEGRDLAELALRGLAPLEFSFGPVVKVVLKVEPGWFLGEDGVWRMSRRAWRRRSVGAAPSFRRLPVRPDLPPARRKRLDPREVRLARPVLIRFEDAAMRCPACRRLQRIDRRELGAH